MARHLLLLAMLFSLAFAQRVTAQGDTPDPDFIPEASDTPYQYFHRPDLRYYLIVSVDKMRAANTELDFAVADGQRVAALLQRFGYSPLPIDMPSPLLTGEVATREAFITGLRRIQSLPEEAEVVVVYSGHGVAEDTRDGTKLWLQMYDQDAAGPQLGVSFNDLIDAARGVTFDGDLAVILDTCFSGAIKADGLSLRALGPSTVVITSADKGKSVPIELPDNKKASAFTYVITDGIENHWYDVDENADGFITYDELIVYAVRALDELHIPMTPQRVTNSQHVIAYDRSRVKKWRSNVRAAFIKKKLLHLLAEANITVSTSNGKAEGLTVAVSSAAVEFAKSVSEKYDGNFAAALALIARGDLRTARNLLTSMRKSERTGTWRVSRDEENFAHALVALRSGDYGRAASTFDKLLQKRSDVAPRKWLLHQAANAAVMTGVYMRAEERYLEALKIPSKFGSAAEREFLTDNGLVTTNLARLRVITGDTTKAENTFKQAIAYLSPAGSLVEPDVRSELADLYLLEGKLDDAVAQLKSAIELREKSPCSSPNKLNCADASLVTDLRKYAAAVERKGDLAEVHRINNKLDEIDKLNRRFFNILNAAPPINWQEENR